MAGPSSYTSPMHGSGGADPLLTNIEKLYSKIIRYQAEVSCQLWRHQLTQYGRDVFKMDDWAAMLHEVQSVDTTCKALLVVVDASILYDGLKNQALKIEALRFTLDARLEQLRNTAKKIYKGVKNQTVTQ